LLFGILAYSAKAQKSFPIALVLSPSSPQIAAYVAGVLGTLIGADLANLNVIPKLGAPVASIGGAGTFDSVFLSGIIAVLLVAL